MNGKTTHAVFGDKRVCETEVLYQYDYGQVLVFDDIDLPETYEVLFSNGVIKDAKTSIGSPEGVSIPDEYLVTGRDVMAWVFLHEDTDDGETEYVVHIPVRPRSRLIDEDITEEEHSIISDLIAVVNDLTEEYAGLIGRIAALEARMPALGGWKIDDNTGGDDP